MHDFAVFSPIIAGMLIGVLSQQMKGRTGVGWGFITAVAGYLVWAFIRSAIAHSEPWRLANPNFHDATFIGAAILTGGVMALLVLTLPNRRSARPAAPGAFDNLAAHQVAPSEEDRAPCPFCREKILRGATVCRYCGRDLPPEAPNPLQSRLSGPGV